MGPHRGPAGLRRPRPRRRHRPPPRDRARPRRRQPATGEGTRGPRSAARPLRRRAGRDSAGRCRVPALPAPRDAGHHQHRGGDRARPAGTRQLPDPPVRPAGARGAVDPGCGRRDRVAAFALSEPDAGSDAAALSLGAEPDGDGWRLHGEKTWISNAPERRRLLRLRPHHRGRGRPRRDRVRGRRRRPRPVRRGPRHGRAARDRPADLRRRPGRPRRRARRGRRTASRWRCARSTCSGPASARSRSAWPRPRSTPRSTGR